MRSVGANKPAGWRKSSASAKQDCVECRPDGDAILVRDSKNSVGPHLAVPTAGWAAFLASVTAD
jgi:hypothetical protein